MKPQEPRFVGIDVAKAHIDAAVRPEGQVWRIPYDGAGTEDLVTQLVNMAPDTVLLEATGGLELPLVAALAAAALPVVVVNPRQVRDFAKATGRLAKTDALDAQVLAHFAEAVRPPVRPLRDADTRELNSLTTRRNQVMTMMVAERNRLGRATGAVRPRIEAHLTWLRQELDGLDRELRDLLRLSPVWREQDDLLRLRSRRGPAGIPDSAGLLARTGYAGPEADCRSGRRGAHQPGQRSPARQTNRLGRTGPGPRCAIHGSAGGQQIPTR